MLRVTLLLALLLVSCGKKEPQKAHGDLDAIKAKGETYLGMSSQWQDNYGFVSGCDSLLWTSLFKVSGGAVDLKLAKDADGSWQRHPSGDCFPGKSKSSISRDMILGLMLAIWETKDLAEANSLVKYLEDHDNTLGEHDGSIDGRNRVYANPGFAGLIYRLRWRLGGPYSAKVEVPVPVLPVDGYEAHLQALTTLLWALMEGGISQVQLNALKGQTERQPNNAVYQALRTKFDPARGGDTSDVVRILMDEKYFPSDRLPTSSDRCVDYLFNHDQNEADWSPCAPLAVHSGTDLLFTNFILFRNSFGFRIL